MSVKLFFKVEIITGNILSVTFKKKLKYIILHQGAHPSGKSQGNLFFLQGQGKVREFCKMVREIRKSSKVREKSGNFKIMLGETLKN